MVGNKNGEVKAKIWAKREEKREGEEEAIIEL